MVLQYIMYSTLAIHSFWHSYLSGADYNGRRETFRTKPTPVDLSSPLAEEAGGPETVDRECK